MTMDSILVMDTETAWPAWVDEGTESNVAVLARRRSEGSGAFEQRAEAWLEDVLEIVEPNRGILVTGTHAAGWTQPVLRALARTVHAGRGRSVVLASSGDHAEQRHLASLLRDLAQELESEGIDIPLQLRVCKPATSSALERVA